MNFSNTEENLKKALNNNDSGLFIDSLRTLKNDFGTEYPISKLKTFYIGDLKSKQRDNKLNYLIKKSGLKTYKECDFIKTNKSYVQNVKIPSYYYKSCKFVQDKLPSYLKNNVYFKNCGSFEEITVKKPSRNEQILKTSKVLSQKTLSYIDL